MYNCPNCASASLRPTRSTLVPAEVSAGNLTGLRAVLGTGRLREAVVLGVPRLGSALAETNVYITWAAVRGRHVTNYQPRGSLCATTGFYALVNEGHWEEVNLPPDFRCRSHLLRDQEL